MEKLVYLILKYTFKMVNKNITLTSDAVLYIHFCLQKYRISLQSK